MKETYFNNPELNSLWQRLITATHKLTKTTTVKKWKLR